jgi:hypothetical protein
VRAVNFLHLHPRAVFESRERFRRAVDETENRNQFAEARKVEKFAFHELAGPLPIKIFKIHTHLSETRRGFP